MNLASLLDTVNITTNTKEDNDDTSDNTDKSSKNMTLAMMPAKKRRNHRQNFFSVQINAKAS